MIVVDAMGKSCPIPVIEAKKAMSALPVSGGTVLVKVDNSIACQNLDRLATGLGAQCSTVQRSDTAYEVTITVGEQPEGAPAPTAPQPAADFVVAVGSDQMGSGSEELGRILLKGFVYAVSELDQLPGCVLFYNGGAHLTNRDSTCLADLKKLQEKGVAIYTCGTCVDYYGIKDQVAVGEITNMYGIVTAMAAASRLISL